MIAQGHISFPSEMQTTEITVSETQNSFCILGLGDAVTRGRVIVSLRNIYCFLKIRVNA